MSFLTEDDLREPEQTHSEPKFWRNRCKGLEKLCQQALDFIDGKGKLSKCEIRSMLMLCTLEDDDETGSLWLEQFGPGD